MKSFEQNNGSLQAWIRAMKEGKANGDTANAVMNGQELKKDALELVSQLQNSLTGKDREQFDELLKAINEKGPEMRESIAQLVYEGKTSHEDFQKVLAQYGISGSQPVVNGCEVCSACSACVSCTICALCVVTGIEAASVTSAISVVETVSAING